MSSEVWHYCIKGPRIPKKLIEPGLGGLVFQRFLSWEHWVIFIGLEGSLALQFYTSQKPSLQQHQLLSTHMWIHKLVQIKKGKQNQTTAEGTIKCNMQLQILNLRVVLTNQMTVILFDGYYKKWGCWSDGSTLWNLSLPLSLYVRVRLWASGYFKTETVFTFCSAVYRENRSC